MKLPFLDLLRVTAESQTEVAAAIEKTLDSGQLILGPNVVAFEQEFAEALGAGHAIGVGSGTDAIEIALRSLGIGYGDEVVTQANTCPPTLAGILRTGASAVLCDATSSSGLMDPESLAGAITARTRAVVPVHLYGQCADVPAIRAVVGDREIVVVEDCAQAHLATFDGSAAGTMGDAAAWSFYPTKNLGAVGDAGAITTGDPAVAERAVAIRQYADFGRWPAGETGVNSRLDELQAAVLRIRLQRLPDWTQRRRAIAARYRTAFQGSVQPLAVDNRGRHVFHLFVVRSDDRDAVREELASRGIGTLVHYPLPLHRLAAFHGLVHAPVDLSASEGLCAEIISLPLYPQMRDAEVEAVITAVLSASP